MSHRWVRAGLGRALASADGDVTRGRMDRDLGGGIGMRSDFHVSMSANGWSLYPVTWFYGNPPEADRRNVSGALPEAFVDEMNIAGNVPQCVWCEECGEKNDLGAFVFFYFSKKLSSQAQTVCEPTISDSR